MTEVLELRDNLQMESEAHLRYRSMDITEGWMCKLLHNKDAVGTWVFS